MFKKLALLSVMLSLGACETINQTSQCDPEKNYIKSNPAAMDEYKELRKKGEIKSFYFEQLPSPYCGDTSCVSYNKKTFVFFEKNFDDSNRKGIYTIIGEVSDDVNNKECMPQSTASFNSKLKYCYKITKNKNNIISSRYKYVFDTSSPSQTILSVYDLKKNVQLYEYSYQVYSHRAVGGPGFGFCPKSKDNNPQYKFNAISFLTDN